MLLTMFIRPSATTCCHVKQQFKFITPGSVIGTVARPRGELGFGEYAAHIGSYDVAYGSIGGVVILMTWFYILGLIYLMGGEINATLEQGSPSGRRKARARPARRRPPARAARAPGPSERRLRLTVLGPVARRDTRA